MPRFTQQARSFYTSWTIWSNWPTNHPMSRPRRNMWVNLAQSTITAFRPLFSLFWPRFFFIKSRHVIVVALWLSPLLFHIQSSSCPHKRKVSQLDIPKFCKLFSKKIIARNILSQYHWQIFVSEYFHISLWLWYFYMYVCLFSYVQLYIYCMELMVSW